MWNNAKKSITELLNIPAVQNFIGRHGTCASQRGRLRRCLKTGKINPKLVEDYARNNPTASQQDQDTRYGSQRRRANLPRKTRKGHTLFGPELPPKPKKLRGGIIIDGKTFTARGALEYFPKLSEFLQQNRKHKETSLHAKLRAWFKNRKIPNDIMDSELEIVELRRLQNNVVGHYEIVSKVNTSLKDFLDNTKNLVI